MVKVVYDKLEIGVLCGGYNLTLDRALELLEIDVNEMIDESTPKFEYELFELKYT